MCNKKHIFTFCLTDEQPIKRILVRLYIVGTHECTQCENMLFVYSKLPEPRFLTVFTNDFGIHRHLQGMQKMFQLNLPK